MEFVTFVQNPVSQWNIGFKPPLLKGVLPRLLPWDASPSKRTIWDILKLHMFTFNPQHPSIQIQGEIIIKFIANDLLVRQAPSSAFRIRVSTAPEDWLVEKFNLDLSLVARLGGHSQPRTHRGKERFPGMTITYALIQMLEKARVK